MSAPAFAWALEKGTQLGLTTLERMVLVYLADKANGERVAWPGQPLIEKYTGVSQRYLRRILPKLAELGLIMIEASPGRVTKYHILRQLDGAERSQPRNSVPGSTPAHSSGVRRRTPAHSSGVTPELSSAQAHPDPGTTGHGPRNPVPLTPEPSSAEPSTIQESNQERARGARSEAQEKQSWVGAPPTRGSRVDVLRRQHAIAADMPVPEVLHGEVVPEDEPADPGYALAMFERVKRALRGTNYPIRGPDPKHDPAAVIAAYERTNRLPPKASYAPAAQLLAARRQLAERAAAMAAPP